VCSHLAPAIPANGHRANFQTFRRRRHTEQYKQDQQCRQDNAEKGTPNRHRIPPRSGGWCGCVKLGSGARLRLEPDLHLASLPSLKNLGSKSRENRSKLLILLGALGEIRTPGPRNRNPMLYPAELRARARGRLSDLARQGQQPNASSRDAAGDPDRYRRRRPGGRGPWRGHHNRRRCQAAVRGRNCAGS
jgi:hypothetical protein